MNRVSMKDIDLEFGEPAISQVHNLEAGDLELRKPGLNKQDED